MTKLLAVISMVLASTVQSAASAEANSPEFAFRNEPRPTITRAIDVVNEGSPREVNAGEDVVFSARVGTQAILKEGFQVRIFTLPSLNADPVEAAPAIEDCLIYFSTVYPVAPSVGPKIPLVTNASEGWLSVQPDNTVGNGYFLLVFERTGIRETVFRIKRGDAKTYFATGLRLIIKATDKSRLSEVVARNVNRFAQRATDAGKLTQNDSKIPCYGYEKITKFAGLAEEVEQLAMAVCEKSARS